MLQSFALPAQDWEAFAAGSSSEQDAVLLSAMAGGDLETALSICRGVSLRADPYMGRIIQVLTAAHTGTSSWRSELLLRVLLQPVGAAQSGEVFRRARVSSNAEVLAYLFLRMNDWTDFQLAGVLVRIAPLAASTEALQAVAYVGSWIAGELQEGIGLLSSQETGLALDFLESAMTLGRPELAEQCAAIARLSREPVLMSAARTAARALLSLPPR
jgi:hypothetical protein